jgi:hypothetical protein
VYGLRFGRANGNSDSSSSSSSSSSDSSSNNSNNSLEETDVVSSNLLLWGQYLIDGDDSADGDGDGNGNGNGSGSGSGSGSAASQHFAVVPGFDEGFTTAGPAAAQTHFALGARQARAGFAAYDGVALRVLGNHGHANFTCLYGLRVHGEKVARGEEAEDAD